MTLNDISKAKSLFSSANKDLVTDMKNSSLNLPKLLLSERVTCSIGVSLLKSFKLLLIFSIVLFVALRGKTAYGRAHDDCRICHGKSFILGVATLSLSTSVVSKIINPGTGKPLKRIEGICLTCHSSEPTELRNKYFSGVTVGGFLSSSDMITSEGILSGSPDEKKSSGEETIVLKPVDVGTKVINLHQTHPVGIIPNPQKVILPRDARGFYGEEEEITCLSCHNHHPSNTNYKYLRWPCNDGKDMAIFCRKCHPKQSKRRKRKKRKKRFKRRIKSIKLLK